MGRVVRMVPANWEHPKDKQGQYIPLFEGFTEALDRYNSEKELWEAGIFPDYVSEESRGLSYEKYEGPAPCSQDYMPEFKPEEKTHYMMYEDCTEGTPISPAFATKEELARWLADIHWGRVLLQSIQPHMNNGYGRLRINGLHQWLSLMGR